jgi:hypothetical protein
VSARRNVSFGADVHGRGFRRSAGIIFYDRQITSVWNDIWGLNLILHRLPKLKFKLEHGSDADAVAAAALGSAR